jgi:hypothetical protein
MLRRVVYLDLVLSERTRAGSATGELAAGETATASRFENVTQVQGTQRLEHTDGTERTVVEHEVSVTERVTRERTGSPSRGTDSRSTGGRDDAVSSNSTRRVRGASLPGALDTDVATDPLDVRVTRYFDVPDETIERTLPAYHRTTATCTDADHLECLPYLLDSLSAVEPRHGGAELFR